METVEGILLFTFIQIYSRSAPCPVRTLGFGSLTSFYLDLTSSSFWRILFAILPIRGIPYLRAGASCPLCAGAKHFDIKYWPTRQLRSLSWVSSSTSPTNGMYATPAGFFKTQLTTCAASSSSVQLFLLIICLQWLFPPPALVYCNSYYNFLADLELFYYHITIDI